MGAGLAMRMRRANGDGGSMMGDLEDEIGLGRMNRLGRMMEEEKEREEGEGEEEEGEGEEEEGEELGIRFVG